MKKLICALVFILTIPTMAFSAPYVITGKFNSNYVTSCVFKLNNGNDVSIQPTSVGTNEAVCKLDVASSVNGANVVNVKYKNIWGVSSTVPFEYTKTLPPTPLDMTLGE